MPTAPGGRRFIIQKGDTMVAGSTGTAASGNVIFP